VGKDDGQRCSVQLSGELTSVWHQILRGREQFRQMQTALTPSYFQRRRGIIERVPNEEQPHHGRQTDHKVVEKEWTTRRKGHKQRRGRGAISAQSHEEKGSARKKTLAQPERTTETW